MHEGETTLGAIDDKLRNAITQLIQFTLLLQNPEQKVKNMILSKNNTYNVGPKYRWPIEFTNHIKRTI